MTDPARVHELISLVLATFGHDNPKGKQMARSILREYSMEVGLTSRPYPKPVCGSPLTWIRGERWDSPRNLDYIASLDRDEKIRAIKDFRDNVNLEGKVRWPEDTLHHSSEGKFRTYTNCGLKDAKKAIEWVWWTEGSKPYIF
jgi:hypothetical protein